MAIRLASEHCVTRQATIERMVIKEQKVRNRKYGTVFLNNMASSLDDFVSPLYFLPYLVENSHHLTLL